MTDFRNHRNGICKFKMNFFISWTPKREMNLIQIIWLLLPYTRISLLVSVEYYLKQATFLYGYSWISTRFKSYIYRAWTFNMIWHRIYVFIFDTSTVINVHVRKWQILGIIGTVYANLRWISSFHYQHRGNTCCIYFQWQSTVIRQSGLGLVFLSPLSTLFHFQLSIYLWCWLEKGRHVRKWQILGIIGTVYANLRWISSFHEHPKEKWIWSR
jgi:hypothetical protein